MTHIILPRHIINIVQPYFIKNWENLAIDDWRQTVGKILSHQEKQASNDEEKEFLHDCLHAWNNNFELQYDVAQKI